MATSSISADVKAANSKLAEFLRRREEEEMIPQIGKKKPKQAREEKLPGGSGRWQLEPDWKAPTPMVDRPRTVAGATSFHFSYISIAKQAVPTVNGRPVEGRLGKAYNPALEHSKYIERDGAAERSRGAEHAEYIEREGAAEMLDPSALMSEGIERTIASVINETPTAEEAELLGLVDVVPEGIPSVFSNISDDPFERQEFWRAVERCEREPRSHQIIFEPDIGAAWWRELLTTNKLDPEFKEHALKVAEAYRQHMAIPVPEGEVRKPFQALPMSVSAEKAGKLIQQAQRMANYNDANPPFEFKSGRGGRIQFRMVAELPYELAAEDRALIVQNFCDHLASLQERRNLDGTPYKTGMMYTAVIHAPDAHNDSRNYHLHVVAYDRPAKYLPEFGQWDFEVEERYNHKGEDRVRYPHRKAKIEEVARPTEGCDLSTSGKNFVPGLRAKFAQINNAVLKARGIRRTLDPRKYTEMGIDRTPTQHLGTKAAALESIGVPTAVGQLNGIAIWNDAERSVARQAAEFGKALKASQSDLEGIVRTLSASQATAPALTTLRPLMVERERLIQNLAEERHAIMTFDHLEAKAKSRAVRTRQTCLQFLADIENGKADKNTRAMRLVIQDRWKGAQAHIDSIDKALAPHRDALAKAAENILAREQRIAEIDKLIEPIKAGLQPELAIHAKTAEKATAKAAEKAAQKPAKGGKAAEAPEQPARPPEVTAGSQKGAEPAAVQPEQLDPVAIEGLPIVEPTITPPPAIGVETVEITTATPEGLDPLRPVEVAGPVPSELETISTDLPGSLEPEASKATPGDQEEALGQDASPPQESGKEEAQPAAEPKVDRRRKVNDPVLFDLPEQEPPVKPGTSRAAYVDFDNLIKHIMDERVRIHAEKQPSGGTRFVVPSLAPEQQELLTSSRFGHRAAQRLGAIHDKQQLEIARVVRWISTQGQDAKNLSMEGRTANLGREVKQSVRTLFKHWAGHAEVKAALGSEYERRVELAKAQEKAAEQARDAAKQQAKPVPTSEEKELAERRKHAADMYPEPKHVFTPEVAEFTRLLRELASKEDIQAAADKIYDNPVARQDVQRHSVDLATAYHMAVEGRDQRLAQQRLRDSQGKGR